MSTCLYIASSSYSGSTLLTMMLGGHGEIATVGEMKGGQEDLSTYRCSCGDLFADCAFWSELIASLATKGYRYDLSDRRTMPVFRDPSSPVVDAVLRRSFGGPVQEAARSFMIACWPAARRVLARQLAYNEAFIEQVLRMTGRRVFVDSSKDPIRIRYLTRIPSLDVRVIHLVRDGRGMVNSARKNAGESASQATREWQATNVEIRRVTRRYCDAGPLLVRYEDVCRNPDREIARVLDFASMDMGGTATMIDGRNLHILGNRMRLKRSQEIRLEESWRSELSADDLAVFERIGGALNRRLGYASHEGDLADVRSRGPDTEVIQQV